LVLIVLLLLILIDLFTPPLRGIEEYQALKILAIETSGTLGSVALLAAAPDPSSIAKTIVERSTPEGQRTAQSLLPTIQHALREAAWRPAELELICVTSGPGSFTGLRIGIVTAKTLAYATGAALVGVHTLAAIAHPIAEPSGNLWTIVDAQRQEVFVAKFPSNVQSNLAPETSIVPINRFIDDLSPGDCVAGPPLAKLRIQLPPGVSAADERFWSPSAAATGQLGAQLFARGGAVSPLKLVPHYYRRSAAEEKALRQDATETSRK
jgi:tRNA threonylcarbamoyladenosine biosynthesis protein TsaB